MQEKKYGLQIRVPKPKQKQQQSRPSIAKPSVFNDDDDDDVEREISRQAAKNKSLKEVEELQKKALEEDPTVYEYDGIFDDIKLKVAQPIAQDKQQRKSKYIAALMQKAKQRKEEHEIVYERQLAKDRDKEEHLYADKEKFVTKAYKKKLEERAQWFKEEQLRELREQRDDVTKKSDLSDFYFSLAKNVAFGAGEKSQANESVRKQKTPMDMQEESNDREKKEREKVVSRDELQKPERQADEPVVSASERDLPSTSSPMPSPSALQSRHQREAPDVRKRSAEPNVENLLHPNTSRKEGSPPGEEPAPSDQPQRDHHKKGEDAIAAARERYLARKRAKVQ